MSDDFDFSDIGDLDMPTMRGNANLDIQDYQRLPGEPGATWLDDELQEDVRSRPGQGAGPAPDIDGMSEFELTDPGSAEGDGEDPSYPWGPGGGGGYRPRSMSTDLSGADEQSPAQEVANRGVKIRAPREEQTNLRASNADIDPATIYDRSSFEYTDSPGNVIGNGIFDMEEGVAWRTEDGQFENNYAQPAYLAAEGELNVQQSEMWDSVANNWRVTQPSGGGVTFGARVARLKPGAYPFAMPEMRPERTGPRSHIEAFGRAAAKAIVDEARLIPNAAQRSDFLTGAAESLGAGQAARCRQVADRLAQMGYRPDNALEDSLAHCVMHAVTKDLADRSKGKNGLPRVDRMGARVRANAPAIQQAVAQHIAPLASDKAKQQADIAALSTSPAAAGMGQVATPEAVTAPSATGRNLLIGAAVAGVGYYLLTRTKEGRAIQRNARRQARKFARKIGV